MKYLYMLSLLIPISCTELPIENLFSGKGLIECISNNKVGVVDEVLVECKYPNKEYKKPSKYRLNTIHREILNCNREIGEKAEITPDGVVRCIK